LLGAANHTSPAPTELYAIYIDQSGNRIPVSVLLLGYAMNEWVYY